MDHGHLLLLVTTYLGSYRGHMGIVYTPAQHELRDGYGNQSSAISGCGSWQRYGARAFHLLASSYEVIHRNGPLAALQQVPPLPVLPGPVFVWP